MLGLASLRNDEEPGFERYPKNYFNSSNKVYYCFGLMLGKNISDGFLTMIIAWSKKSVR